MTWQLENSFATASMFDVKARRPLVRSVFDRIVRLLQRTRAAARRRIARMLRRQTVRALRLLDDRLLADIGLQRDDIAFVLRLDEPRDTYAPEPMMFCRLSLQS
jgi:uncharacterized protein YjiS (DUF1127 family)